jgi:hypothetical protein
MRDSSALDSGAMADAGGAAIDGGLDACPVDSDGGFDAGVIDSGVRDAGAADAGRFDGGRLDAEGSTPARVGSKSWTATRVSPVRCHWLSTRAESRKRRGEMLVWSVAHPVFETPV